LPVLQKTAEAYKIWHAQHAAFPRLSKFTLGAKIDGLFTDLIESLLMAGYASPEQKAAYVARAAAKLDLLKFFIQSAWELKCLDHKKYAALAAPLAEIGRMVGGWRKTVQNKAPDR
jgi:hypothetical protein